MTKIALIADIHGNDLALQAVLDDIRNHGGVDAYWILGDLVAIGPAPVKVLEMLDKLPNARFIRGNTDRYIYSENGPYPALPDVAADLSLLPALVEIEGCFSWTQGAVTAAGWLDWLRKLPLDFEETLANGTRVLCVHAAPNEDDGLGIKAGMDEDAIKQQLAGCQADLICVGHTHLPFHSEIEGRHILNPGSVSNPVGPDKRACCAIITAEKTGWQVEQLRVDYDRTAVVIHLERLNHPAAIYIRKLLLD